MKPLDHVYAFRTKYGRVENSNGHPNWILADFISQDGLHISAEFDFKNDAARRAFGALCHVLYTSAEYWRIETERMQ